MKPTIGRIVHFGFDESWRVSGAEKPEPPVTCCAAIITEVGTDNAVRLKVFHPNGSGLEPVNIWYPHAETLTKNHWSWPPREE